MRKLAVLLCLLLSLLAPEPARAQFADQATWGGTAGGTANAITVTVSNLSRHTPGVKITFVAQLANTSAVTFKPNPALSTAPAMRLPSAQGPVALAGGEIQIGNVVTTVYDGTFYQILSVTKLNGVRAVTSAPTIAPSDCGNLISLGGSAFYNVVVGAPSGFPTGCRITFANADATRGKGFSANGSASCRMFPQQAFTIASDGSAWSPSPACYRWVRSNPTLHVSEGFGSDDPTVSDCLAALTGGCRTFDGATTIVMNNMDGGGLGTAIVQADCDSQYTLGGINVSIKVPLYTSITFLGNPTTPTSCIISLSNLFSSTYSVQDGAASAINGFELNFTSGGSQLIQSRQLAIIDFLNVVFGNVGGTHVAATDNATVNTLGNYQISGTAGAAHMAAANGGSISIGGNTVNMTAPNNINTLYSVSAGGRIVSSGGATTFGGTSVTGRKYGVANCGQLSMGGSTLPSALTAGTPNPPAGDFICGSATP